MPRSLLLLPLLLCTGCLSFEEGSLPQAVLDELGDAHLSELFGLSFGWTLAGGFVGAVLGLLIFFALRWLGAYRWEWTYAWVARLMVALALVGGLGATGAAVGFGEGFTRGCRVVLDRSRLGTEVFPVVGEAAADASFVVAAVGARLEANPEDPQAFELPDLKGFREGSVELDVVGLVALAERLPADGVENVCARVQDDLLTRYPDWKGGKTEVWLGKTIRVAVGSLAKKEAKKGLQSAMKTVPGLDALVADLIAGLGPAAASGDPKTISRAELATYYVHQGVVPALMLPIVQTVRGYQVASLAVGALLVLLPPLFFWFAERMRAGAAATEAAGVAHDAPGAGGAPEAPPAPEGGVEAGGGA